MHRTRILPRIGGLAALIALSGLARSQTFLVDFGSFTDVPDQTYGAGAHISGYWYGQPGPFDTPQPLIDRFGFYTGATLSCASTPPLVEEDDGATSGDDDALCDDGVRCGLQGGVDVWHIDGLEPGIYDLYTYAFSAGHPDDRVEVALIGSIDPPQTVGGAWPGQHVQGVTYSRHRRILEGTSLALSTTRLTPEARVAGFQLVRVDDSVDFGTSYCPATSNSTGSPARLWVYGTLDQLTLRAEPLPEPGPALFFYGPSALEIPFGNGKLCVGAPHTRLRPLVVVQSHLAELTVDLGHTGYSTIHLQCWFRDPAAGGAFFNLSSALSLP